MSPAYAALAAQVDEDTKPIGHLLVEWLAGQGRWSEAVSVAWTFNLITEAEMERAFADSVDVLKIAGLVSR